MAPAEAALGVEGGGFLFTVIEPLGSRTVCSQCGGSWLGEGLEKAESLQGLVCVGWGSQAHLFSGAGVS